MYTFKYEVPIGPAMDQRVACGEVFIKHNSDLSGLVIITCVDSVGEKAGEIKVPGEALVEFVAEYVRGVRISALEQVSTAEVLGLNGLPNPTEPGPRG